MSRRGHQMRAVALALLVVNGVGACGQLGSTPQAQAVSTVSAGVKAEAAKRKETRREAEARAKRYIVDFNDTRWRSITARSEAVKQIARTDSDAAYDFILQEIDDLQELRGEMKSVTRVQAEEYEEMLTEELDEMTPDQEEVKARVAKAGVRKMDLDEFTIVEERANAGAVNAKWGGNARVGSRNRLLTAIQESKLYKAVSKAARNTRRAVKRFLRSLCQKLRMC